MRGEVILFDRIIDLPAEAERDAESFRIHGPKSNVTIPLSSNGQTYGALAFATLGDEHAWQEDEVAELKLLAQIIGNVLCRREAELREEQMRRELAHAMRFASLGELAAALAHELNQPLTAILSNAQAAQRFLDGGATETAEVRTILGDTARDGKRAGHVIHNLRQMLRKCPAEREACSLNELAAEVAQLMQAELVGQGVDVRWHLAAGLPCVDAARVELQQVLVNLVVNAIHAMEDTPPGLRSIGITTRRIDEGVELAIRDHGHGLPPDRLADMFDPFVSTKPSGLGMGLSISRRIIEAHAGRLEAQSHDDGATFRFWLPAAGAPGP
jgi:C4-dicarboxylate-specific signal transduction histidine kinase